MIRQHLQRDDSQQRTDARVGFGERDHIVGVGAQARIILRDDDCPCAAHFDFIDATDDQRNIFGTRDEDDRESLAYR